MWYQKITFSCLFKIFQYSKLAKVFFGHIFPSLPNKLWDKRYISSTKIDKRSLILVPSDGKLNYVMLRHFNRFSTFNIINTMLI